MRICNKKIKMKTKRHTNLHENPQKPREKEDNPLFQIYIHDWSIAVTREKSRSPSMLTISPNRSLTLKKVHLFIDIIKSNMPISNKAD